MKEAEDKVCEDMLCFTTARGGKTPKLSGSSQNHGTIIIYTMELDSTS